MESSGPRANYLDRCVVLFGECCANDVEMLGASVPLYAPGSSERLIMDEMIGKLGWDVGA